jgi:small GTP-binding protein
MEGTAHPQAVKLLLVGDSGTGKSSLLLRFTEDKFLGEDIHMATIGVDFKVKFLDLADLGIHRLKLTIWDTAGQERFRTLTSSYFRGAHGVVLVYDVNDRDTFRSISDIWLPELERSSTSQSKNYAPVLMLVGNKVDKSEQQVTTAEGQRLAKDLRCLFMECSAKTRVGVRAAFEELVRKVIDSPHVWAETSSSVFSAYGDTSASNQCAC